MIDKRGGKKAQQYRQELKDILEKRLLSEIQIAKHCEVSQALVRFWRLGERAIQDKEYRKIKELLNLKGSLKEAKREIIGRPKGWCEGRKRHNWCRVPDKWETASTTDLAKHWDGFKVGGIKPAYEPIIWAVKPPESSYVDNVLKWGVGAVNVDECRVGIMVETWPKSRGYSRHDTGSPIKVTQLTGKQPQGRFPANVILSHHPECEQVGVRQAKADGNWTGRDYKKYEGWGMHHKHYDKQDPNINPDGYETVEFWNCHPECPIRLLDEQSGASKSGKRPPTGKPLFAVDNPSRAVKWNPNSVIDSTERGHNDSGGASRYFKTIALDSDCVRFKYTPKASRSERNAGLEGMEAKEATTYHDETIEGAKTRGRQPRHNNSVKNNHPTVKPIALFEYLIKLVTREGQVILDPFLGSGTTAIAAHKAGRKCVGIERELEYITIARKRIEHWQSKPQQMEMGI